MLLLSRVCKYWSNLHILRKYLCTLQHSCYFVGNSFLSWFAFLLRRLLEPIIFLTNMMSYRPRPRINCSSARRQTAPLSIPNLPNLKTLAHALNNENFSDLPPFTSLKIYTYLLAPSGALVFIMAYYIPSPLHLHIAFTDYTYTWLLVSSIFI